MLFGDIQDQYNMWITNASWRFLVDDHETEAKLQSICPEEKHDRQRQIESQISSINPKLTCLFQRAQALFNGHPKSLKTGFNFPTAQLITWSGNVKTPLTLLGTFSVAS